MLSHLFLLQQILAHQAPEPKALTGALCRVAVAFHEIVIKLTCSEELSDPVPLGLTAESQTPLEERSTLRNQLPPTGNEESLIAGERTFRSLLHGLDVLSQFPEGMRMIHQAIHQHVEILQVLLQKVCDLATANAKSHSGQPRKIGLPSHTHKKLSKCLSCRTRGLKCDKKAQRCEYCRKKKMRCNREWSPDHVGRSFPDSLIMHICELIISMIACLDLTNISHRMIMEGFSFLLYQRVGDELGRAVFGSEETESQTHLDRNDKREDDVVIGALGPYLVWILGRAQAYLSRHNQSHIRQLTTENSDESVGGAQSTLTFHDVDTFARKRLQNTLLKAVFKERASTEFEPTLTRAYAPTNEELLAMEVPRAEVKDWFKHEVWRMVGWDVLRSPGLREV